jgi:hypothetical protein
MAFLGAPASRPEEDTCFIATFFDLDRARLDWEGSALVAWVLSPPPGTDRVAVTEAFRRKYRLHNNDLMVSKHFPEEYLIKFASKSLRDKVMRTERSNFKINGIEVHFRPYRAVAHAYNAHLHYRVHLHVDGLPPFAWRPEVVDQLLARRCAVQRLDDGFTTMEMTSSFGLWAWMPDPQRIPKALWCTFANKAPGGLSSIVGVSEDRPDQWKRGITFRVLLHLDCIEDYTGAPELDGGEPISDFRPSSRALPVWRHGTGDGAAASALSVLPASIPPLAGSGRQTCHGHQDDAAAEDAPQRPRSSRGRGVRLGDSSAAIPPQRPRRSDRNLA